MNPWTVARQVPLFMGFPRQEYWNGLPFPSPGDLPDPGIEPGFPALQADSLPIELQGKPQPFKMDNVKKTDLAKCWQICEATGILIYSWWKCKLAQPL